jgi:superfamily II DNA/RNA helicase
MAEHLTLKDVRDQLSSPASIEKNAFEIVRALSAAVGHDHERVQDLVLRALEHRAKFGSAATVLDGLVRQLGLYPYLNPEQLGAADAIAYEFHRPDNFTDDLIFHRVQADVYRYLLDGDNVILSAPTSFGKSLIIDAMIASGKYQHVAIVVPTIALIDETRRRLARRFGNEYKIITHPSQGRAAKELLIMTQERILQVEPLTPIDFFVIDEFYKLQPRPEDMDRSLVLNAAFYRLYKTGARFYLLGPSVKSIQDLPEKMNCRFIKTDFKTVASEVRHFKPAKNEDFNELVKLCRGLKEATLIYCSSPMRARAVAKALLDDEVHPAIPGLAGAVDWVAKEYHPDWLFGRALAHGIGLHHGRLPRTLSQYVVKAFNEGQVRFLVCTSTLIEGVNTKAKNVIVFDNKVAQRKFDYFTYNNILGRSGRMFEHFVGHVYVFREPPAQDLPLIDFPVFTQPDDVPESLLVQIDKEDLGAKSKKKLETLEGQNDLSMELIRQSHGVDPRQQVALAQELRKNATKYHPLLSWTTNPTGAQMKAVCNLIWQFFVGDNRRRAGASSGAQLAYKMEAFRHNKTIKSLLDQEFQHPGERTADDIVEETIEYLRTWCSFAFPRYLLALDRIQRSVFTKLGRKPGNYAMFAAEIENWFLDPAIMALDEYGIPVQVGQRLQAVLKPEGNLDNAIKQFQALDLAKVSLSDFERDLLRDARAHL